ncbi:unnamed protein product [Thlaspi arvense]|uniref:GATA-type domain-containing protein n=1 Tax=Thlaspi arvense TaxID=13288 RepID=A0AAU9RXC6_THLAR|nr:unnamed protein product [Thlaspi arvense]
MENGLDLTLRLGLPSPTVTHLSFNTPTTEQGINVDGRHRRHILLDDDEVIDNEEGARNNVNVNIRYYSLIFNRFAGIGETLNFAPYPTRPYPAPAPAIPVAGSDYVLIDVPARRAHRNNSLAMENALDANANPKQRRGCGGCCGGRINVTRRCTNLNCNAIATPMWRRGPLGPKTLCNACGIKFRKEAERRTRRT